MEKDSVLEKYKSEGFGKNAFGWYFNPWIDEYDENYDPHNDKEYNPELNGKDKDIKWHPKLTAEQIEELIAESIYPGDNEYTEYLWNYGINPFEKENLKSGTREPEQDIDVPGTNSSKPKDTEEKPKVDEPVKIDKGERVIEDKTIFYPKVSIVFHAKSNRYEIIDHTNNLKYKVKIRSEEEKGFGKSKKTNTSRVEIVDGRKDVDPKILAFFSRYDELMFEKFARKTNLEKTYLNAFNPDMTTEERKQYMQKSNIDISYDLTDIKSNSTYTRKEVRRIIANAKKQEEMGVAKCKYPITFIQKIKNKFLSRKKLLTTPLKNNTVNEVEGRVNEETKSTTSKKVMTEEEIYETIRDIVEGPKTDSGEKVSELTDEDEYYRIAQEVIAEKKSEEEFRKSLSARVKIEPSKLPDYEKSTLKRLADEAPRDIPISKGREED